MEQLMSSNTYEIAKSRLLSSC